MDSYLNSLVTSVWIYDIDNYRIVWANNAALHLWESNSLEELSSRDFKPGSSDAVQQTLRDYQQVFKSGQTLSRFWQYSPKGILKEAYCQLSGYTLEDGRMALMVEAIDADHVKKDYAAGSIVSLSTYTLDGKFVSGNPPFLNTQDEGFVHIKSLFANQDDYVEIMKVVDEERSYEGDVQITINDRILWHRLIISIRGNAKSDQKMLVQQFNIDDRKREELALEKEVVTDSLTGLLNRRGLKRVLKRAEQSQKDFVVFYIDLDGFKLINDSLGHGVGDRVLQSMAERLAAAELSKGHACRFGGDEFIWVIDEALLDSSIEQAANQLIEMMNRPFYDAEGRPITVSVSIGIAHYPKDGADFENLILKADAAMYLAKKQGKHRWVNYLDGMEDTLQRQSKLAQHLFQALNQDEFSLHYQPIFNVESRQVCSLEALLRWKSPVLGWVPTDECIRVAEEIGVIIEIEKWVISTAIRDLKEFRCLFDSDVTIAINVSTKYFANPDFVGFVSQALNENGFDSSAINIELTEGALLFDLNRNDNAASKIVEQGMSISIDDFGTGYSSLAYLYRIPATHVKIDRSFTERVEDDATMVSSIQHLIESLKFEAVVEGVESLSQSKLLAQMGIKLQQGFGLGLPKPLAFYLDQANREGLPGLNL
ncbi:putative bifunctional diguanylate cyclase/phosphodiesterase [Motiliproteus coralliicola]|nr:EAL domain-containing protein [Motiliproteus coralliicola]